MTREEVLEKFKTQEAAEIFRRINRRYRDVIFAKRDLLAEKLKDAFWKILEKVKDYPEFQLQEVQFSCLQVHIMDGTYQWLVELHDEKGDYTREDISELLEMKEIFGVYEECREELYQAAAKYVNTLTPADCDLMMAENYKSSVMYLYLLGVYAFRGIDEEERFRAIPVKKIFRILIGGRRDKAFVVFAKHEKKEDPKTVLERLTKTPEEKDVTSQEFILYDFSDYEIKNCNISFRNFPFTSFRRCQLDDVELMMCKCTLSDWRGAEIKNALLEGNCFHSADFTGANLENVSFEASRLDVAPDMDNNPLNPTLIPVSFREAKLQNIDFRGAFLTGCDFRGAEIGRVNFEGADLTGAKLPEKYREIPELTEEQRKSIDWIKE